MDTLRIILIVVGLALVAGIYLWGRRMQSRRHEDLGTADESPEVDGFSATDQPYPEVWDGTGFSARGDDPSIEEMGEVGGTDEAESMVVVLSVMAPEGTFKGPDIMALAKASGLHFGRMDIFHYFPDAEGVDDEPWFGIANVLEPGTFDLESVSEMETPGLIFFLQLPGPADGTTAFDRMLETAQAFTERLGAQLCDERRQPVGAAQLAELRERVRGFDALATVL